MKNDFNEHMIEGDEKIDDYLGVYKNSQNDFKLLSGHKLLVEIIREKCTSLCEGVIEGHADKHSEDDTEYNEMQHSAHKYAF